MSYAALHHKAMEAVDEHQRSRRAGDFTRSREALLDALALESKAAASVARDNEPTRSVLHRSAASIALQAGRSKMARRLIASALKGNPPDEVRMELIELLEDDAQYFNSPQHLLLDSVDKGSVIQQLTIRSKRPLGAESVARIQTLWARVYESALDIFYGVKNAQLRPICAYQGSYTVQFRVRIPPAQMSSAFEAFEMVGRLTAKGIDTSTRAKFTQSRELLELLFALSVDRSQIEASMFLAGEDSQRQPTFLMEAPSEELLRLLQSNAARSVHSEDVPQANDILKVFSLVEHVSNGRYPTADELGVVDRQVSYYRRAAEILGYLHGGTLTPSGAHIVGKTDNDKKASALVHFEASTVGSAWLYWSGCSSLGEIDAKSAEKFLVEAAVGLSKSTAERRAKTLQAWKKALA